MSLHSISKKVISPAIATNKSPFTPRATEVAEDLGGGGVDEAEGATVLFVAESFEVCLATAGNGGSTTSATLN